MMRNKIGKQIALPRESDRPTLPLFVCLFFRRPLSDLTSAHQPQSALGPGESCLMCAYYLYIECSAADR
jgi:hypothetical protein